MKKRRRLGLAIGGFLGFGLVLVAVFFSEGILRFHYPSRSRYPVRGVDVSAHQGDIDWSVLAGQDVQFAYIKATEGSGFTDRMFADNWEGARRSGLRVGAYHFFSFDSGGDTQADRFIGTVPKEKDSLPPAVDVEFYGEKAKNPPHQADVRRELDILLDRLEEAYGTKPVLYATGRAYDLYLKDAYEEHPIWIRNILTKPELPDGRNWTFWQYADRARLDGYRGEERFIDLNVFAGSEEEFQSFL